MLWKHRPLVRLDGEAKLRDDEMRRLIQQVPTDKEKAFAYDIEWDAVHEHNITEKKLRHWVKKKVTEYLGAEEQGMVCDCVEKQSRHPTTKYFRGHPSYLVFSVVVMCSSSRGHGVDDKRQTRLDNNWIRWNET